jgi:uncharacterized repeat protein (TIGR02543 family)
MFCYKVNGYYANIEADARGDIVFGADGSANARFQTPAQATIALTLDGGDSPMYTTSVTGDGKDLGLSPASDGSDDVIASFTGDAQIKVSGDYNSVEFEDVPAAVGGVVVAAAADEVLITDGGGMEIASKGIGHSIAFRTLGGTPIEALANIPDGTRANAPNDPVKEGFVFGGWYTDVAYRTAWSFASPVTADLTLYAKWDTKPIIGDDEDPYTPPPGGDNVTQLSVATAKIMPLAVRQWTNKQIKPAVKVTLNGTPLRAGIDYAVSYGKNKNIGKGSVTITGKGQYIGNKAATFNIVPKKLAAPRATPGKLSVKIKWKKATAAQRINGYQIQYRIQGKKWTTKKAGAKAISLTVKKLQKGKKYDIRVRAYKKVGGSNYYGPWSKIRKTGKVK